MRREAGTARVIMHADLFPAFFVENRILPIVEKGLPPDSTFEAIGLVEPGDLRADGAFPLRVALFFRTYQVPPGEIRDFDVVYRTLFHTERPEESKT